MRARKNGTTGPWAPPAWYATSVLTAGVTITMDATKGMPNFTRRSITNRRAPLCASAVGVNQPPMKKNRPIAKERADEAGHEHQDRGSFSEVALLVEPVATVGVGQDGVRADHADSEHGLEIVQVGATDRALQAGGAAAARPLTSVGRATASPSASNDFSLHPTGGRRQRPWTVPLTRRQ